MSDATQPCGLDDIDTPFLAIDLAVMDRNIERLAGRLRGTGVQLRPHAKSHKCVEIAQRQIDSGAIGLTVATIGEAEVFADAGFTDLFIAYPLWLTPQKADRIRKVTARAQLRVGVDSIAGARQLAEYLADLPITVVIEVDSGHHRTGVDPAEAGDVAAAARAAGLNVVGVFTFPGHGYTPGHRAEVAAQESHALGAAAESLRAQGIEPTVISGGSTPTVDAADNTVLTEVRPGVYPFNDAQQFELEVCTLDDIALSAVTTVVHTRDRTAVVDAGSKILGADRPGWATGFGRVISEPDARIIALSEHHATIEFPGAAPDAGTRLRIAPNHLCNAVNLVDTLVVDTSGGPRRWAVAARGANT
ncbi:D-TA family PLP-dependent enzyme [Mycobacteroides chelonae]|uniref:D-TA family PLP-dependent enzyme n=1 Tax=Mycobacteroides chelonae TaxID=1774 RepID=UPI0008AA45E8|nr:D-TA family PLP-dependent enzyme [Mycobacteroides chelonae]AYM41226.1 D-TA family PLP-dependent enzyme [[Mycobacterium] chelonae subsp. gwanakae]OHU12354.1 alanine racemase [Mycobacteroides chelonae]